MARSLAADLERDGGQVQPGCEVTDIEQRNGRVRLVHSRGETRARFAVFCAGVWADELAVRAGADPDPRIVPFRGAYLRLRPEKTELVRGLIYPVPNPELPFLGVHLSRHIDGDVSLGPSALLAPTRLPRSLRLAGHVADGARAGGAPACASSAHAASSRSFAREAADYVPELEPGDFSRWYSGTRAQALARDGSARGRLRALGDRARAPRAQRAVAGGHLIARSRPPDRRPGGAGP